MGCGASTDNSESKKQQSPPAAKPATVAKDEAKAYLGDVRSISSAEYVLFAEMDARTASAFEAADEPSSTAFALRKTAIAMRGKVQYGVNEDPDQYDASTDIPEFKQRDRKRITEWVKQVALATPDGFDEIPTSFYLPVETQGDSSHSSGGGRHPLDETVTTSSIDLLQKLDSFSSHKTDAQPGPETWSNGGGVVKGRSYRINSEGGLQCEDVDGGRQ